MFYIQCGPIWLGNIPEYAWNMCSAVGAPRSFLLLPKTYFWNVEHGDEQQKTMFCRAVVLGGHLVGDISHKSCSCGPYGPFRFSVNSWFWYVNFHEIMDCWGTPTFQDFCINELNSLGQILKPSSMLGVTPQGLFVSRKYTWSQKRRL